MKFEETLYSKILDLLAFICFTFVVALYAAELNKPFVMWLAVIAIIAYVLTFICKVITTIIKKYKGERHV